ncbi:MAG: SHOCT domain-containing protein [Candidatus Dormiibacterota bacterium]
MPRRAQREVRADLQGTGDAWADVVTPGNGSESAATWGRVRAILPGMYGSPFLVLIVILMVVGIGVRLYGMSRRRGFYGGGPGRSGQGAEQILARRFANGEISEDEYQRRLAALRQNRPSN